MRVTLAPTLEDYMDDLHRDGWSTGDVALQDEWMVYCTKDEQCIQISHKDRTRAWGLAVDQARLIATVITRKN